MATRSVAPAFRRIVIGFRDAGGSRAGLEAAVQFARALETELVAVFVEDASLLEWSSARPVRQLSGVAHPPVVMTPERLAADFAAAAMIVRRRLSRLAEGAGLSLRFEVARSRTAALDFAGAEPDDLLVVVEPADRMARLSHPFAGILRAVAASSSPVLYVPHGVQQRRGPVVAITGGPDDAGGRIAAAVAASMGETLVRLAGPLDPGDLDRALAGVRERLLVLGRPALTSCDAAAIAAVAAQRQVPAVVVGPAPPIADGAADR